MKQHQSNVEVRSPVHWILPAALAATVGPHVAGIFLPGISAWGFNIWTEFPHWIGLAGAAGTILLVCLSLAVSTQNAITGPATATNRAWLWFGLLSLGTYIITVMLGPAALVYGDGYAVVERSVEPVSAGLQDIHALTKPLPTMLWRLATSLLATYWNFSATNIVFLVGGLIGALAVAGLWSLATLLSSDRSNRILIFLVAIAGGSTLLFLGHIEYYVWSAAALVWLMVAGLSSNSNTGITRLVVISAFSLLTNVMLLPAVVITILMVFNKRRGASLFAVGKMIIRHDLAIIALLIGSIVAVVLVQFAAGGALAFVPPLPVAGNAYSALSLAHLRDTLNWLFFFSPIGLPLLVITVLCGANVRSPEHVDLAYLASIAWVSFLVSFWVDPQLGAVRDWDLLSFVGIPLSLYGATTYTRWLQERGISISRLWLATVAAAALFVLVPHIVEKHDLNRAVVRLDRLLWQDPHYQVTYNNADRCMSWASILSRESHRSDLAQKHFFRRLEAEPTDSRCWYDLGVQQFYRGKYDSAAVFLRMACQLDTNTVERKIFYALTLEELGRHDEVRLILGNMDLKSLQATELLRPLGELLFKENLFARALAVLHGALQVRPNGFSELIDLGFCFEAVGQIDSALYYSREAKAFCPPAKRCALLQRLVVQELTLRNWKSAEATLGEYAIACPNAPDLDQHRRAIAEAKQQTARP